MKKMRKLMVLALSVMLVLGLYPTVMAASTNDVPERILLTDIATNEQTFYDADDLTQDITGNGYYWNAQEKTLTIDDSMNKMIAVTGDLDLLVKGTVTLNNITAVNGGLIAVTGDLSISSATNEPAILNLTLIHSGRVGALQVGDMNNPESTSRCSIHSGVTVNVTVESSAGEYNDGPFFGNQTLNAVTVGSKGLYLYGNLNVNASAYVNVTGIKTENIYVLSSRETGYAGALQVSAQLLDSKEGKDIISNKVATGIDGNIEVGPNTTTVIDVKNAYQFENELGTLLFASQGVTERIIALTNADISLSVVAEAKPENVKLFDELDVNKDADLKINNVPYDKGSIYNFLAELDDNLMLKQVDDLKGNQIEVNDDLVVEVALKPSVDPTKYALPDSVSATMDGLDISAYITYDSDTGKITIPELLLKGSIAVKATSKELISSEQGTPGGTDNGTTGEPDTPTSPKTGDTSLPIMWMVLAFASIFGLCSGVAYKKRAC